MRLARVQHVDDLSFGSAAPIRRPTALAVARSPCSTLCISRGTQEEIGAAVVGNEKAEAVGMSLHGAA